MPVWDELFRTRDKISAHDGELQVRRVEPEFSRSDLREKPVLAAAVAPRCPGKGSSRAGRDTRHPGISPIFRSRENPLIRVPGHAKGTSAFEARVRWGDKDIDADHRNSQAPTGRDAPGEEF